MNSLKQQDKRPKVGIGVCIVKEGKVLLGKRKNSHGDGCWSFPGGHLELNESWEDCAIRETLEETGLNIKNLRFTTATNDIFFKERKHYITIFMKCEYNSGTVELREPEKCERWDWFEWEKLPSPLFVPLENLIRSGFHPFEQ